MVIEVLDTIKQVSQNSGPYTQWRKDTRKYEQKRQEYYKTLNFTPDQLKQAENYGSTIVNAVNIMDRYSEDKAEDIEKAAEITSMIIMQVAAIAIMMPLMFLLVTRPEAFKRLNKFFAPVEKKIDKLLGINFFKEMHAVGGAGQFLTQQGLILGTMTAIMAPLLVASNYFKKKGSRIARFQAREQVLNDPKNFVIYDQDQLEKASQIASQIKEEEKPGGLFGFLKKKSSEEELYGKKDGAIASLKSIIKDWKGYNQWKVDYQQEKLAKTQSFTSMKVSEDKLAEAKAHQQIITDIIRKIDIKAQDYSENTETVAGFTLAAIGAEGLVASKLTNKILGFLSNKGVSINPNVIKYAPAGVAVALAIPIISYFTHLQKDMARVGRYKAKKELLNDPKNFIYIPEKELNKVNVSEQEKSGIFNNIKNHITTGIQVLKDYKEYKKYEKTVRPEEVKLQKALQEVELKPGQLEQGKALQTKVFDMFEVLDDNSQRYAEDIELATTLFNQAFSPFVSIGSGFGTFYLANKAFPLGTKGKIAAGAVGYLGSLFGLQALATSLQKRASKIGVMKAIDEMKDPRNFVDFSGHPSGVISADQGIRNTSGLNNGQININSTPATQDAIRVNNNVNPDAINSVMPEITPVNKPINIYPSQNPVNSISMNYKLPDFRPANEITDWLNQLKS